MSEPDDTQRMNGAPRLDRAVISVHLVGGLALAALSWLILDLRASIAALAVKVDAAVRSATLFEATRADERIRDLEKRITTLEATSRKP